MTTSAKIRESVKIDVSDLSLAALDVQSIHYDWSEGYGDKWEHYEEGEEAEGPMMNYFYPLPNFHQDTNEAAKKLKDVALCLVRFNDAQDEDMEYVLALTGGGMDMTWDICEAFIALGYVPPRKYWRLPQFAGMKMDTTKKTIIAAIRKGLEAVNNQLAWDEKDLNNVEAALKANSK